MTINYLLVIRDHSNQFNLIHSLSPDLHADILGKILSDSKVNIR